MEAENPEVNPVAALPIGWEMAEFDDTCEPISDGGRKVQQKAYLPHGNFPVIDQGEAHVGGFTNDTSKIFQGALPVIAFGDHTRRFKLIDQPFAVGADGVKLIRPLAVWNVKCLWYFLQALKFEDRGYSRHFQFLRKSKLPLPPSQEQLRISDAIDELLSDLHAGVSALEQVRAKLKLYRASVLKSAVDGTLTAEWRAKHPDVEPASELLKRILFERRRRWEDDQLGKFKAKGLEPPKNWRDRYKEPLKPASANLPQLPKDWHWATIDQLCSEIRNGYSAKPNATVGTPILRISAVRPLALDLEDVRFLSGKATEYADSWIQTSDLLFTRYNGSRRLVGVCAIVPKIEQHVVHPDKLIRARPLPSVEIPSFIAIAANVGASRVFIEGRIRTTAGQAGVSGSDIKELPVPLAPTAEQAAIVEAVEDQLSIIEHLESDLDAKLISALGLRQAVLQHAFSGKLVPQDPKDEPAAELLKRIVAEREERERQADKAKRPVKRKAKAK